MPIEDLRQYSDAELSLRVMNDEGLYRMRHDKVALLSVLNTYFVYNSDQLAELEQDLEDENED